MRTNFPCCVEKSKKFENIGTRERIPNNALVLKTGTNGNQSFLSACFDKIYPIISAIIKITTLPNKPLK